MYPWCWLYWWNMKVWVDEFTHKTLLLEFLLFLCKNFVTKPSPEFMKCEFLKFSLHTCSCTYNSWYSSRLWLNIYECTSFRCSCLIAVLDMNISCSKYICNTTGTVTRLLVNLNICSAAASDSTAFWLTRKIRYRLPSCFSL